MTVSNVINNKPNVRPHMRQRVLDAIAATSYRVNPVARALAGGKSRMLSVITQQPHLPYVAEVLTGAAHEAQKQNYDLVVLMFGRRSQSDLAAISRLSAGALLIQPSRENLLGIADLPEHVVSVDGPGPRPLGVDNYGGACQAMQHLLSLGHTRIGFITGLQAAVYDQTPKHVLENYDYTYDHKDAPERLRAYRDCMKAAGLQIPHGYIQDSDYSRAAGERAAKRLLSLKDPPTAIFASCDAIAIGAIHVAQSRGLSVPQQLSVVGFDDFPVALQSHPTLTTVRQPLSEIGAAAVRLLVAMAEDWPQQEPQVFPTELVVRESTCRPT